MPVVEVNGARVYFEDTGAGGGPVVFSHGILMDHEMFAPQIAALRDRYRCIAWDQRGHGATESEGSFSYWDSARDLLALLDHLGIEHAFLAGMSQGGFVSLRAALLAPERVRGLFLIDTQAGPEDPARVPMYDAFAETWSARGPNRDVAETVATIILGPAEHGPWIEKWMARPPDAILEPYRALTTREDITDRLVDITCPAVVVHGEVDGAISMEQATALCEGLRGCDEVIEIAGAGHAANLSHPDEVNRSLHTFLERHVSGTTEPREPSR